MEMSKRGTGQRGLKLRGRFELRIRIWKWLHLDEMHSHAVEEGDLGEARAQVTLTDRGSTRARTASKGRKKIKV